MELVITGLDRDAELEQEIADFLEDYIQPLAVKLDKSLKKVKSKYLDIKKLSGDTRIYCNCELSRGGLDIGVYQPFFIGINENNVSKVVNVEIELGESMILESGIYVQTFLIDGEEFDIHIDWSKDRSYKELTNLLGPEYFDDYDTIAIINKICWDITLALEEDEYTNDDVNKKIDSYYPIVGEILQRHGYFKGYTF